MSPARPVALTIYPEGSCLCTPFLVLHRETAADSCVLLAHAVLFRGHCFSQPRLAREDQTKHYVSVLSYYDSPCKSSKLITSVKYTVIVLRLDTTASTVMFCPATRSDQHHVPVNSVYFFRFLPLIALLTS